MPMNRRYRKRRTKRAPRRGRRRYRKFPISSLSTGNPLGLPIQKIAKVRYATDVTLVSSAGVMAKHFFRANGLNDPDQTGTGSTPAAHTLMTDLYNHYVVLGSKITVIWSNASAQTGALAPTRVGCYTDDDHSVAASSYVTLIENGKGTSRILGSGGANDYKNTATVGKYSAKKYFNVTDVKDNTDRLGAATSSNPTELVGFLAWVQALGSGSATVQANVIIDYIVAYSEPKTL